MLNIHQIFFYDIGHWCEQIAGDSYWIFDSQAKRYSDSELNCGSIAKFNLELTENQKFDKNHPKFTIIFVPILC